MKNKKLIKINELTIGLNQSHFSKDSFHLNKNGHPKAFECSLVPGMTGELLSETSSSYLVKFPFYSKELYVLKNHAVMSSDFDSFEKVSVEEIFFRLHSCKGMPYLWGGNHKGLTTSFMEIFGYQGIEVREKRALMLYGIDCSGLLFYATNYQTPRNTSELQYAGVAIANIDVKPLDLILTKGHVAIILPNRLVIQSKQNRGVYLTLLDKELYLLNKHKTRVDIVQSYSEYSIRRILSIGG